MPLLSSLAIRFLLAVCLFAAGPGFAAEKLDLTPYMGGVGTPGDFKVFSRSTGGQRKVTLLGVEPWKKGWKEIVQEEVTGAGPYDGTRLAEGYLIPGKQLLSGNEYYSNGLAVVFKKPAKGLKLQVTPGKVQRIKQKGLLLLDLVPVANARLAAAWWTDGFEGVSTPSGSYAGALRAQTRAVVLFENRRARAQLVELSEQRLWFAAGWGLVRREIALEVYDNGFLVQEDAWAEELSSGSFDGVPFP